MPKKKQDEKDTNLSDVVYKYIGKGTWLFRIPMRDLTRSDVINLENQGITTKVIVGSKLYKKAKQKKSKESGKEAKSWIKE